MSLRYDLPRPWVVARDPKRGVILCGGYGGLGVGQMWTTESESDKTRDGYAEAEIVDTGDRPLFGISPIGELFEEGGEK